MQLDPILIKKRNLTQQQQKNEKNCTKMWLLNEDSHCPSEIEAVLKKAKK